MELYLNIITIEPTPSPNTMKIVLDEELPGGTSHNYTKETSQDAPPMIKELLSIDGVKMIYHVADFLAIERNSKFDWQIILPKVRAVFGENVNQGHNNEYQETNDAFGEVQVFIQMFRDIPMQVKLTDGSEERRVGLSERFMNAAIKAQESSENLVKERKWKEHGVRYGTFEEIGEEIVEEISATYSDERLENLVSNAYKTLEDKKNYHPSKVTLDMFNTPNWKDRYALLEQMNPTKEDLPVLTMAVKDVKANIRRLAVAYLGMIDDPAVLPLLYKALTNDRSVAVRRTAGDCLSDIGDPDAIDVMIAALKDRSKLVRWRAAMFLYETGDQKAVPALEEAQDDPEFEVSMQVNLALKRIKEGKQAEGSVWKQMTDQITKK